MLLTEIMDRAKAGYDTFYTGCARGMDIVFGRQVLLVKATSYPNIRLIGVVPHEGQMCIRDRQKHRGLRRSHLLLCAVQCDA